MTNSATTREVGSTRSSTHTYKVILPREIKPVVSNSMLGVSQWAKNGKNNAQLPQTLKSTFFVKNFQTEWPPKNFINVDYSL